MVSYPYTLMMDVPLNCFNNVKTTSQLKVLFGNNGCLSTIAGVGAIMFSGAKALAGKAFRIRSYGYMSKVSRGRLIEVVTSMRDSDARPVTGTVIGCTGLRSVKLTIIAGAGRFTNLNLRTVVSKASILIKGDQLLSGFDVGCPARLRDIASAVMIYTVKNDCTNCLLLTSTLGSSTGATVSGLGTLGVRGVRVLSNSGRDVIAGFTRGLNVSGTCNSLLPSNGIGRLRRL